MSKSSKFFQVLKELHYDLKVAAMIRQALMNG
jgi:hypothetical protein